MNMQKSLINSTFLQCENSITHSSYSTELNFYDAVKNGDWNRVNECMSPLDSNGFGTLSPDEIRNCRYHLIITTALITRFCIEGGMNPEAAYTLSDLYIQKADKSSTKEELSALHMIIVQDFTKRMRSIRKEKVYSKPICLCLDYIYENLHQNIVIKDLSNYVGLNPTYLSTLFKKETGMTIASYVRAHRIESARNMLKYSEYSPVEISNYLSFSSHSHFIHTFKQYTGMTPKEYQNKYFRSNWK